MVSIGTTESLKKEFSETREFKERDFVKLFICTLGENGITSINQKELEDRLFPYMLDEKYRKLFNEVYPISLKRSLNLDSGFNYARYYDYVKCNPYDYRIMTILSIDDVKKDSIEKYYSEEHRALMQSLVSEYKIRTEAEQKGRYKLGIYGINPDRTYHLITGKRAGEYNNSTVTWQLITDGIIVSNNYSESGGIISCDDPRGEYEGIGLKNAKSRDVTIKDATFAIEQGKMEYGPTVARLYTKTLDEKKLELLANYSTVSYIPGYSEALTKEEPHVYVLKI